MRRFYLQLWTHIGAGVADEKGNPSPLPSPLPKGRGRIVGRLLANLGTVVAVRGGRRSSLAPSDGERVRVRGKPVNHLHRRTVCQTDP
jgi:hypothetical protein